MKVVGALVCLGQGINPIGLTQSLKMGIKYLQLTLRSGHFCR